METRLALAKLIKERIRIWSITDNGISIIPRNSLMHVIEIGYEPKEKAELIFQGFIKLSDFTDIWAKILECSLGVKDFSLHGVFKELLDLEVSLRWEGLLRKRPLFTSNPHLQELERKEPNLKIDNKLAIALNKDRHLLRTITKIKPYLLYVELTDEFVGGEQNVRPEDHCEVYSDPKDMIWRVSAILRQPQITLTQTGGGRALSLLEVMETISDTTIRVTREIVDKYQIDLIIPY